MPNLFYISDSDTIVERKLNFFHDWFQFYAYKLGKLHYFELENPLSLIEKIIYQIENNLNNCIPYIDDYFSNSYFFDDLFLQSFKNYSEVKALLLIFRQQNSLQKKKEWINSKPELLAALKDLKQDFQKNLFRKSLNLIISYITCRNNIEEHIEDIKYHTKIIVSEYFFNGITYNDIDKIFLKILSQNIKEFPFPPNLKTKLQKESHLKNIDTTNQLEGLYTFLFQKAEENIYLFRIYGISINTEFSFEYEGVKLFNKDNNLFKKFIKGKGTKARIFNDFFNDDEVYIIAIVKTAFQSPYTSRKYAVNEIKKAIEFLDAKFERTFRLDDRFYLYTNNFKRFGLSKDFKNENIILDEKDIYKLKENIFLFFKKPYSPAQEYILKYEHLWTEAQKTKNIADYWHYIESLLHTNNDNKRVKRALTAVVLISENQRMKNELMNYLGQCLNVFNIPIKAWNLNLKESEEIVTEIIEGKIPGKLKQIDYPFLKELLNLVNSELDGSSYFNIHKYFNSIVNEAYAQRNFYIHSGLFDEKSYIKLDYTFPPIMTRFRFTILKAANYNKHLSFEELISFLIDKGESLLPIKPQ